MSFSISDIQYDVIEHLKHEPKSTLGSILHSMESHVNKIALVHTVDQLISLKVVEKIDGALYGLTKLGKVLVGVARCPDEAKAFFKEKGVSIPIFRKKKKKPSNIEITKLSYKLPTAVDPVDEEDEEDDIFMDDHNPAIKRDVKVELIGGEGVCLVKKDYVERKSSILKENSPSELEHNSAPKNEAVSPIKKGLDGLMPITPSEPTKEIQTRQEANNKIEKEFEMNITIPDEKTLALNSVEIAIVKYLRLVGQETSKKIAEEAKRYAKSSDSVTFVEGFVSGLVLRGILQSTLSGKVKISESGLVNMGFVDGDKLVAASDAFTLSREERIIIEQMLKNRDRAAKIRELTSYLAKNNIITSPNKLKVLLADMRERGLVTLASNNMFILKTDNMVKLGMKEAPKVRSPKNEPKPKETQVVESSDVEIVENKPAPEVNVEPAIKQDSPIKNTIKKDMEVKNEESKVVADFSKVQSSIETIKAKLSKPDVQPIENAEGKIELLSSLASIFADDENIVACVNDIISDVERLSKI